VSGSLDQAFYALTPDKILDAVEVGGRRATGYALQLSSYENRVYEVELEDGARLVAKFYRPGRWSEAALREEHTFLAELVEAEVPAIAPLAVEGEPLRGVVVEGGHAIWCALFDKVRGRATEEPDDERLEILGRLLARLHNVGAERPATERARLDPYTYGTRSIELLIERELVPQAVRGAHRDAALRLVDQIAPIYERLAPATAQLRVHADCHHGNLLWDQRGPFFLDFDDFTMGPAVQDLWLVAPGRDAEARGQRAVMVEAYETLRAFDHRSLALIEPLRALRLLRYAGWIGARYDDPSFQRAFPDFLEESFWRREVAVLAEQSEVIAAD